jgi:diguanylate cyclase (GGDEF)-like protein
MACPPHELVETAFRSPPDEREYPRGPRESDRRLADVYRHILSEQSLDTLLERIAETLADLVPYDAVHIYEADEARRLLIPVFARSDWSAEIMRSTSSFGEGITGWAVEHREPVLSNSAQLDPRVKIIPGTPREPEALITVPLVARGALKGALNIYRLGGSARFVEHELELARWFADAAALALDNAQVRARLEQQAYTDSLTGLYNHRYFHERLRGELNRAARVGDATSLVVFDIDDFKRVNDIHGHAVGDQVLTVLARLAQEAVRSADVVCRIGGEEFAVIMPSCDVGGAVQLAWRLSEQVDVTEIDPTGSVSISVGIASAPSHALNPHELLACADVAMLTAKAGGKRTVVVFDGSASARPNVSAAAGRDRNSIAHLKMLDGLAGRLNRLPTVTAIGEAIATELRQLIEYDQCRMLVADGNDLVTVAAVDEVEIPFGQIANRCATRVGEGIAGRVVQTGEPLFVRDGRQSPVAVHVAGSKAIDESVIAVPLRVGAQHVTGAIAVSKLGNGPFDDDDLRLLEVLAGHAAAPLENARLYEAEKRAGDDARSLLELGRELASFEGVEDVLVRAAELSARLLGSRRASVWLQDEIGGELRQRVSWGSEGEEPRDLVRATMRFGDGTTGVLAVSVEHEDSYGERFQHRLGDVALQARIAIDSALKLDRLQRIVDESLVRSF